MSQPPMKLSKFNCRNKRRYADEFSCRAGAQLSLNCMQQPFIYVYKCPECRGWHISSKAKGGRNSPVSKTQLYYEIPA